MVTVLTVTTPALAAPTTRDLPGDWQEGRVVVEAPLDVVRGWLVDYDHWPELFPDVQSVEVLSRPARNQAVVRFRSRIVGRELTIGSSWGGREIRYRGGAKNIDSRGRVLLRPLGPDRTEVVMQSTSDVHGLIGVFATRRLKRERAFAKLNADLGALENVARTRM
jgi:uncharacterized membrane protein